MVCGGLGGVMAAAARGAAEGGGLSLGILPGNDRREAAPQLTLALASGLGELRNALLVRASDGLIAVGGSWGTLSEVALARRQGLPVVWLRGWSLPDGDIATASSPADAVEAIFAAFAGGEGSI